MGHVGTARRPTAGPEPAVSEPLKVGRRRVTLDIGVQLVARILNLALGVVVTLVLVHALGSRGFGVWSTLFAISQIAGSLGDLGLNQLAVSRAAGDPDREAQWLGALLSLRALITIPITMVAITAIVLVAPPHARLAGILLSLVLLVGAPSALTVIFQLRVRNDISIAIVTVNSVVWGAAVVVVALLSGSITAFAAAFLAGAVLSTGLTVALARRTAAVHLRGTRRLWGDLLRIGVRLGAAGILVTLYVKLDQILVFQIAGSRQAGLYGAAYRLLDQIQFIPISVMTTLFPLIASAYSRDRDRARDLLQVAGEYLTMASLPILAFTIVAAHPIVTTLLGPQFAPAAPAVPILAGAFVSISVGYLLGNMVVILEVQRQFLRYAAIALVINVMLNLLLIPHYGFLAAAWVTLFTEVTVMSLTMRTSLRALDMRPRVGRLARTLLAALAMGVALWVAREAHVPLAGLVAVAGISYGAALMVLRVLTPGELRAVLRKEPLAVTADGWRSS